MNRRRVLAAASGLAVVASTGCIGDPNGRDATTDATGTTNELDVDGEEPTLEPGASHALAVETTGVQRCQFTAYCRETDAVSLHLNDADLDPGPTAGVMDSYPQIWTWEQRRDVRIVVPVDVADDAPPGTCEYAVAVSADDGEDALERRFEIEVTSA